MGLRPTQGDEKRLSVQQLLSLEALPFPLSSRPKRSAVERSLCGCSLLERFSTEAHQDFLLRAASKRPRVRLSVERAACRSSTPRVSTGIRVVERSAVQRSLLGQSFRGQDKFRESFVDRVSFKQTDLSLSLKLTRL
jgi:hypothetical protein